MARWRGSAVEACSCRRGCVELRRRARGGPDGLERAPMGSCGPCSLVLLRRRCLPLGLGLPGGYILLALAQAAVAAKVQVTLGRWRRRGLASSRRWLVGALAVLGHRPVASVCALSCRWCGLSGVPLGRHFLEVWWPELLLQLCALAL
jgi:hypothetical protein